MPIANLPTGSTGSTVAVGNHTHAGGASLTVREQDGSPSVGSVTEIRVANGSLTDEGGGVVSIATSGGPGTVPAPVSAGALISAYSSFR